MTSRFDSLRPGKVVMHGVPVLEGSAEGEYAAERGRAVLERLRVGAAVGMVLMAVAWGLSTWVLPGDAGRRHQAFLGILAFVVAALAYARGERAARHAVALAVGYHVGVAGCLGWLLSALPGAFAALAGPVALSITAAALLVPWGVGPQAVVSAAFVGAFLLLQPVRALPTTTVVTGLFTLWMGIGVSLVGAAVMERQRRHAFVRRRQVQTEREQARVLAEQRQIMVDATRLLGGTLSVSALCDRLAEVACWLPGVEGALVTVPDRSGGTMRIVATWGEASRSFKGIEYPREEAEPSIDVVLAERLLELPDPNGRYPAASWFELVGVRRAILAPVVHDGELLAMLAVGRRSSDVPFGEAARHLVEVLVDRAALALANARLVEDLQRATAVKAEFVSMMSHEIRTPLNVITGYVEMLQDGKVERETALRRLAHVSRELLELVQATLDVGRLDAGHDEPQHEPVALGRFWDDLGAHAARLERHATVRLVWEPADDRVIVTDPRKLRIVVKNLVGNALKFTTRGEVKASCHTGAGRVQITIGDTGCGIPADELPYVFEMFRQVDGRAVESRGGVGLGLYIVHTLVEQLGGRVTVESVEGWGTTFHVDIPDGR